MVYRGKYCFYFLASIRIKLFLIGYIDDVRNTDNAWMETEVWNFHYGATVSFPQLRIDDVYSFRF